jgi:hypothetical protein
LRSIKLRDRRSKKRGKGMAGHIDSRVFGFRDNHFSAITCGKVNATLRYSYKIARFMRSESSNNCQQYSNVVIIRKI